MKLEEYRPLVEALLPAVLAAGRIEMAPLRRRRRGRDEGRHDAGHHRRPRGGGGADAKGCIAPRRASRSSPRKRWRRAACRRRGDAFFLVDPLDGTRAFIKGSPEFTINIGLIVDRKPVFGIIYAPALDQFFATLGPDRVDRGENLARGSRRRSFAAALLTPPGNARARPASSRCVRQPFARVAEHR